MQEKEIPEMIDISSLKDQSVIRGILKKVPILTDQLIVEVLVLDKDQESATHNHESSDEVEYIVQGRGRIQVDKVLHEVKDGHTMLVPRSVPHRIMANGGSMTVISIRTNPGMEKASKNEKNGDQETT